MTLVLWELEKFTDRDKQDFKVIAETDYDIAFDRELLKIGKDFYKKCSYNEGRKIISLEKITPIFKDELENKFEITCPHCSEERSDSWEYDDDGSVVCDACGSNYDYQRNGREFYSSKLTSKNETFLTIK